MKIYSLLIVLVILPSTSCIKPMVLDISVNQFKEGYEKTNPKSLGATTMLIRNDKTTIYPPFNKMPPDATYYVIPSSIKYYKHIENLHLVGLFVKELPTELQGLPNLENISFSIGDASSLSQIVDVLKLCNKLKALHLMTAIMTNAQLNKLKRELHNVNVSIQP